MPPVHLNEGEALGLAAKSANRADSKIGADEAPLVAAASLVFNVH